jgi:hypothetical protein
MRSSNLVKFLLAVLFLTASLALNAVLRQN